MRERKFDSDFLLPSFLSSFSPYPFSSSSILLFLSVFLLIKFHAHFDIKNYTPVLMFRRAKGCPVKTSWNNMAWKKSADRNLEQKSSDFLSELLRDVIITVKFLKWLVTGLKKRKRGNRKKEKCGRVEIGKTKQKELFFFTRGNPFFVSPRIKNKELIVRKKLERIKNF